MIKREKEDKNAQPSDAKGPEEGGSQSAHSQQLDSQ